MKKEENVIELTNITQSFENKSVLLDLSANFKKGNVTALLGKSGSGKSTLLKLINGMIIPQKGYVKVFGEDFNYQLASEIRLKIGYVVQHVGLFPHLTIFENISLLGKITNQSKNLINERTHFLMDSVHLTHDYLKKYPYQLSGGEQQRAGLCRALFLKPPLLLMDEPFASLDYSTRTGIYSYFKRLQETEPCSVIIVTHQFEEAELLADEFIWLEKGQIKKQGNKIELSKIKLDYLSAL